MHDLDRTLRSQESEFFETGEQEHDEWSGESNSPLGEVQESERAAELLTVANEEELDYVFGKLFRRIGQGVSGLSKRLAPLGNVLKPLAKKFLPIAAGAVGTFFGGPAGGALGSKLGSLATRLFELEAENFAPDELEMEVARRFVRLSSAAAQNMIEAPVNVDPNVAARRAVAEAARIHAPVLVRGGGGNGKAGPSGRWVRRGNRIVIFGV